MLVDLPVVDEVHQPCKNCTFAVYDGKTQTGCVLGRTDQFRRLGNLVEAEDEERQFFIVNGRICSAFNEAQSEFFRTTTDENRVEAIYRLLSTRLTLVVVASQDTRLADIEKSARDVVAQEMKPHEVVFINNLCRVAPAAIRDAVWKIIETAVPYSIHKIVETKDGKAVSTERAVDLAAPRISGSYFSVFSAGAAIPKEFVKQIDHDLNVRMERFALLTPAGGEGLTVQTSMFKWPMINGNAKAVFNEGGGDVVLNSYEEKIAHYAAHQNKPWLHKKVTDVCPAVSLSN